MEKEEQHFLCIECGKNFDKEEKYEIHYKIYHENNPQECDICGEMFLTRGSFYNHQRTAHLSNLATCKYCKEEMPQGSLTSHIKGHQEDNKKENTFKCDQCNYETNLKTNLTRHAKIYWDPFP